MKNPVAELAAVAVIGALGGVLWALVVLLLVIVFAGGFSVFNDMAGLLAWLPVAVLPVVVSGLVWYVARARTAMPRFYYGEGVAWGLCAVALLVVFALLTSSGSYERGFVVAYGLLALLASLPALLTVAPLTLWAWVQAVSRLRA